MQFIRNFLFTIFFLAIAGIVSGHPKPEFSKGSQNPGRHETVRSRIILPSFRSTGPEFNLRVPDPGALLLDSVYGYNWEGGDWSLTSKNYRSKNSSGLLVESLYKKYIPFTGKFENYGRVLYNYSGAGPDPESDSSQFWYSNAWITFQYNHYISKDLPDETYNKMWSNVDHKFVDGTRSTIQYNDSLLPIEVVSQSYDTATKTWVNSFKNTYSYNAMIQPVEQIIYSWETPPGNWVYSYKTLDVYDANFALVNHLEYTWDAASVNWLNTTRISYHNNPASLPDTSVLEVWNNIELRWDSVEESIYTYNQYNWLMNILTNKVNDLTGTWYRSYLTYYTYFPATGNQESETGNVWDTLHLTYIQNHYRQVDSVAHLLEEFDLYIDLGSYQVVGGNRDSYTYSPAGDTLSKLNQEWNVPANDWTNKTQELYTYDSHNLLIEDLVQDWVGSAWENSKKSVYYYSEFIGIIEHQGHERLCFHANPMKAGTSVQCPGLDPSMNYIFELISMKGERIDRAEVNGITPFTISNNVAAGNYILRITESGKTIYREKVFILK